MEDNDIVALLWERQEPALAHLQDKYSTYLMQITRRIIIDEEDAKECVNDVWLKVWNSIPPGKPTHLAGYLAKIARNLALDKYRQHNAAKRGGGHLEASLEELEECISGSNEIEEKINIEHLKTVIQQFLERSPKKKRIIFLQRYFYMLDTAEIAYMMQMKETSILATRIINTVPNYCPWIQPLPPLKWMPNGIQPTKLPFKNDLHRTRHHTHRRTLLPKNRFL